MGKKCGKLRCLKNRKIEKIGMNIWTRFHGNLYNTHQDISLKAKNVDLMVALNEKLGDHQSEGFILWGPFHCPDNPSNSCKSNISFWTKVADHQTDWHFHPQTRFASIYNLNAGEGNNRLLASGPVSRLLKQKSVSMFTKCCQKLVVCHLLPVAAMMISKLIKLSKLGCWNYLSALRGRTKKYYTKGREH